MGSTRQVLLATMVSMLIFLAAGGKIETVVAKARGKKVPQTKEITAETLFAWGFLFVTLMVVADIPATSKLGVAFAWLIFATTLMGFGPEAFANLSRLAGVTNKSSDTIAKGKSDVSLRKG